MKKLLAGTFLRITGWKSEGEAPTARKFVLVAAPHTTNWDLPYMLALAWSLEMRLSWMGKHGLFRWPFGGLMRWLGGIPIRRHLQEDVVTQMAAAFGSSNALVLAVPAEATRALVKYWRSGFYHIAMAARVPIVLGFLDYSRKSGGFGPAIEPSGDIKRDMDKIRAFYADKVDKYPEKFGEVRLREETE